MKTIQNILICVAVAMVSLLGSCKSELDSDSGLAPGTVQVQLVVPHAPQSRNSTSRANTPGTADEDYVGKVQLIFWNTTKGVLERYITIDPAHPIIDTNTVWNPATGTLTMADANLTDKYRIYVMANGTGTELAAATTEAEINQAFAQHTGAIINTSQTPLPMSGISVEGNLASGTLVPLRRMVAKVMVRVTLDENFVASHPNYLWGSLSGSQTSLQLINVPHKTFVLPRATVEIPSDGLVNDNASNLPVVESGVGAAMSWQTTAYVYENPTADAATSMKIALNLPYKDGSATTVTENLYTVEINHAAATSRVERNYIYQVNIVVKGLGYKPKPVTVTTTVLPWNVVDKPSDVGHFVAFKDVTQSAKSIPDGSNLDDMGIELRVSCNTNIGGWYTITRNEKGGIIHEGRAPIIASTGLQSVDISIPKIPENSTGEKMTVTIYYPAEMAGLGTVKVLHFTQIAGFIPNWLLIEGGWKDNLPTTGLQVAKRGNLSPVEGPEGDDPFLNNWGEQLNENLRVDCGAGIANYKRLKTLSYEISSVCNHLGPEWYIPSLNELSIIYRNQEKLGTSYTYHPYVYWTSSDAGTGRADWAWAVNLTPGNGAQITTNKRHQNPLRGNRVRCVRNL